MTLVTAIITHMHQEAAAAAYYLPQYDQRRIAQQCKDLGTALDAASTTAAPVKRFSFARRAPAAPPAPVAQPAAPTPPQPTGLQACLQHIPPCRYVRVAMHSMGYTEPQGCSWSDRADSGAQG